MSGNRSPWEYIFSNGDPLIKPKHPNVGVQLEFQPVFPTQSIGSKTSRNINPIAGSIGLEQHEGHMQTIKTETIPFPSSIIKENTLASRGLLYEYIPDKKPPQPFEIETNTAVLSRKKTYTDGVLRNGLLQE